jgi:HK97 family phage prohead protease
MLALTAPAGLFAPRATIDADGTVEGYASLFGEIDQARDMVMPGAFAATLRARNIRRIPMLFQHDPAEPVGVWLTLREDMRGLYARGRLIPEVARGRELLSLLRAGAIDGLSIGFKTVKGRIDPKTRIRKLDAVELWEISIVTFPLLTGARVHAVKEAPSRARGRVERDFARACGRGRGGDQARTLHAPPAVVSWHMISSCSSRPLAAAGSAVVETGRGALPAARHPVPQHLDRPALGPAGRCGAEIQSEPAARAGGQP